MTHQPEPIRKSSLPTTPPPEWEFFTFFPYPDDDGGDMVRGQRQRGVQVRRLVTYGDWEPVRPDRWADEPERAAVSAAVAPPTNHTADEADADTVANRAAQVISTMGAEIRELKHSRDRYRTAWLSARHRVALRRMADETATETQAARTCPPDCPCHAVCIGPIAGARQDGAES